MAGQEHLHPPASWQPLALLQSQFQSNLQALNLVDAELAGKLAALQPQCHWMLAGAADRLMLGQRTGEGPIHPLPNPVPPAAAAQVAARLFPSGKVNEAVLIAGADQGWLWRALLEMPVDVPQAPGHKPPFYFLCRDLERLWVILHLHDWRELLRSGRALIFAGSDCVDQLRRFMQEHIEIPWARLSVTVDPAVWPAGISNETVFAQSHQSASQRLTHLQSQLATLDARINRPDLARRLQTERLRIMGITSRFTTFLQYSMRDWLSALQTMGHETRLVIEQNDHEMVNPLILAEQAVEFQPDLILLIDHYRGELRGLPAGVPCVMWIQDRLPNMFRPQAGAAQQAMDYVIGYGKQDCVERFNYPAERFMPCRVGFNEKRFSAAAATPNELSQFACDVSFVSHASASAEALLREELDKTDQPQAKRFLNDLYQRLEAIYAPGSSITEGEQLRALVLQSMQTTGVSTPDMDGVLNFVVQKLNNAFFRHQSLQWLAELDIDLRLYGRGWDHHPRLSRFARGSADNERQLATLYQASKINLQVTPFGAVHQRVFDGLAAGGFFLMRHCIGDDCDLIYHDLWQFCRQQNITSGQALLEGATPDIHRQLDTIAEWTGRHPRTAPEAFLHGIAQMADEGFTRSPALLWGKEYPRVAFRSRDELHARVRRFLASPDERAQLTARMRQSVLETMTYTAISRRMLAFIAADLAEKGLSKAPLRSQAA